MEMSYQDPSDNLEPEKCTPVEYLVTLLSCLSGIKTVQECHLDSL